MYLLILIYWVLFSSVYISVKINVKLCSRTEEVLSIKTELERL